MVKRRAPVKHIFPEPWPLDTTDAEIVHFASEKFPKFLLLFISALRKRNNRQMIEDIKLMRAVVTKLDQFRRMKVHLWQNSTESNQTTEHPQQ